MAFVGRRAARPSRSRVPTAGVVTCRFGVVGAAGTLAGVVLSGPFAVLLVEVTHPQPSWQGAEVFAAHVHPIQSMPYAGGLVLVSSLVVLVAALHELAAQADRAIATAALVFSAAFASLISFNYAVQTSFVPVLAQPYDRTNAALLSALTMSNPRSLAWALEMWGWALFGVATALLGNVFQGGRVERYARLAFVANGPISVGGAALTCVEPGWVMTTWGIMMFALWNLLLAVMAVLALLVFRRRLGTGLDANGARSLR